MAISSEIEKLEKRWQATSGLVFAPLAEAYRKAGLQARALEILEQGLALHVEYGPALIVRARCHLDTGDFAAAEEAFNQALARDPLDPIALRGLADVCERTGRLPEAIERLRALVDVDPRNSEAKQVLERLLATPAEIPEAIASAPVPEPAPEYVEPVPTQLDSLDFDVVNLSAAESLPAIPEERAAQPAEPEFMVQSFAVEPFEVPAVEEVPGPILWTPAPAESVAAPSAAADTGVESWSPPAREPEPEPELIEPAAAVEAEAPAPEPVIEAPVEVPVEVPAMAAPAVDELTFEELAVAEPVAEQRVEEVVAVEAAAEPAPALPELDFVDESAPPVEEADAEQAVALVEEPTVEEYALRVETPTEVVPAEVVVAGVVAAEVIAEPEPQPEFHAEPAETPALIVTESMAELFLKQGHRELALAVYRQLSERSPESDSLRGAIARLEQELAPPPAPAAPTPVRGQYAAAETGGRSVERRLQSVLHAPPPSTASTVLPPAIEPGAEPTRPSADALSLSAVFGDEPAVKARRDEESVAEANAAEPSYDEFFGAGPSEPAAAPAPRGEGEDLRQFNEWLKGLKR